MPGRDIYYKPTKLGHSLECCFYQLSECQNTQNTLFWLIYTCSVPTFLKQRVWKRQLGVNGPIKIATYPTQAGKIRLSGRDQRAAL